MKRKNALISLYTLLFVLILSSLLFANSKSSINFSQSELVFSKERGFVRIELSDSPSLTQEGAPELPQKGISLIIPQDVKVKGVKVLSYEKEALVGEFYVYPIQKKVPIGYPPAPFIEPDPQIYNSELSYPGKIIEVAGDGYMEGFHIVHLLVYPLEYIPKQRRLSLYTRIDFQVEYVDAQRDYFQPPHIDKYTLTKLSSLIHNPEEIKLYKPQRHLSKPSSLLSDSIPYVIITTEDLISSFEPLKLWKTRKGTKTEIKIIEEIELEYDGVDLAEEIKNFITDAKANWNTEWILLGGDVDLIPSRYVWYGAEYGDTILTDHYYSCLDNSWNTDGDDKWAEVFGDETDLIPDGICVGRIPVGEIEDVQNFVSKLLSYEKNSPHTDYQTKALFLSSFLFDHEDSKRWCDTLVPFIPDDFHVSGPLYDYGTSACIDSMNQGFGIIVNCSHAQHSGNIVSHYDGWTEVIDKSDIFSLTNTDRYSVMFNATCFNNKLDEDCLSKYFIKNSNGGGVGYIGTSDYEWYFESRKYGKELLHQIFSNGLPLGKAFQDAKLIFLPYADCNSTSRTRIMGYILLGDPQMDIWTQTPELLEMACPAGIDTGLISFSAKVLIDGNGICGVRVWLTKDDEVYQSSVTVEYPEYRRGTAYFSAYFPTPGWAYLVASKKDHIPAEDSIPIGGPYAPDSLVAIPWSCHYMHVEWSDNSSNEQCFKVERRLSGGEWAQIGTTDPDTNYFDDASVGEQTRYYYRVRAYNAVGNSEYSNEYSDMTPSCPDPGCPYIYVWDGQGFLKDNVILTGSEDEDANKSLLTDYYVLSYNPEPKDDKYELEIREFENEVSRIDRVRLFAIDYPQNENIGVTPEGKLWLYSNPISPVSCVDQDGVDHLAEILTKDKDYFISSEPGYLIVNFGKLGNSGLFKPSDQMGSGGGGGVEPPPKAPSKLAPIVSGYKGNVVYVDVVGNNGEWENVAKVYPRTRSVLTLVELMQYVKSDEDFRIRIRWDYSYNTDHIAFYRFDDTQIAITELILSSSNHSVEGDVNSILSNSDGQRAELSFDQTIGLSFLATPDDPSRQRSFLLVAKGYYETFESSPQTDSLASLVVSSPTINQNYPNPFNPVTQIRFILPKTSKVTVTVYNILGQKVNTLVNDEFEAGNHTIYWDGKNDKGEEVASGVYFYRIKAGEFSDTKKMLLLR